MNVTEDAIIIYKSELRQKKVQRMLINILPKKKWLVIKDSETKAVMINLQQLTCLDITGEYLNGEFVNSVDIYVSPEEYRMIFPESDKK